MVAASPWAYTASIRPSITGGVPPRTTAADADGACMVTNRPVRTATASRQPELEHAVHLLRSRTGATVNSCHAVCAPVSWLRGRKPLKRLHAHAEYAIRGHALRQRVSVVRRLWPGGSS